MSFNLNKYLRENYLGPYSKAKISGKKKLNENYVDLRPIGEAPIPPKPENIYQQNTDTDFFQNSEEIQDFAYSLEYVASGGVTFSDLKLAIEDAWESIERYDDGEGGAGDLLNPKFWIKYDHGFILFHLGESLTRLYFSGKSLQEVLNLTKRLLYGDLATAWDSFRAKDGEMEDEDINLSEMAPIPPKEKQVYQPGQGPKKIDWNDSSEEMFNLIDEYSSVVYPAIQNLWEELRSRGLSDQDIRELIDSGIEFVHSHTDGDW